MSLGKKEYRNPWSWVSTLYYAQGIPYVIVMTVAVVLYKRLGLSNADIALYTSWLYLPWVIKPLWSPFIDMFRTKRFWIVLMQFIVGICLAGVAFTIPTSNFLQYTLAFFWLIAFSSATHDIAADGFYMLGLTKNDQAFFVGIRSTFYRLAMITGQGLLIILAGYFEINSGPPHAEFTVYTQNTIEHYSYIAPDSAKVFNENAELKILANIDELSITTNKKDSWYIDSVINAVRTINASNGFYDDIEKPSINGANLSTSNGNIAIVSIHLTKSLEPGALMPIHVERKSGDKSILLIEGERLIFNESNWNKPAFCIIQLDPNLTSESEAVFAATSGNIPWAWKITFLIITALFIVFFIYHYFILPYPIEDKPVKSSGSKSIFREFFTTFSLFFKKKKIGIIITFLLIYRFGEAQLVKLSSPFLLDPKNLGGLGLTTGEVGFAYGTMGVLALTLGGILGGFVASKHGLKKWLWWMFAAINIPHILYIYLAYALPDNFLIVTLCVAGEQFGYGFGFTAYMLYMIYVSEGEFKTAHYAICTGFMALSMMLPGMISGWIQEMLGYKLFFVWILLTMIPGFFVTKLIPLESDFGKKSA